MSISLTGSSGSTMRQKASLPAKTLISILIMLFLSPVNATSQGSPLKFEELSIDDGLSQSIVECILQDRNGFMWFGTESGLNKYDGYDFTVIVHDPDDPNSLTYNHILSICEDRFGYIWVGTFHGGLDRYDQRTGEFRHYVNDPQRDTTISHNYIGVIREDSRGQLWIGTGNGLSRFNKLNDNFTRFLEVPSATLDLGDHNVLEIFEDRSHFLWIGLGGGGLIKLDLDGNVVSEYRNIPGDPNSLSNNSVRAVSEDTSGMIWIGTIGGGLNRLDPSTGFFESFRHDPLDPESLSNDQVFALYNDPSGSLWIGTNGGGLDLLEPGSSTFTNYHYIPNDPTSISYNEIYDIFEDRSGVIWLGTYGGGTNKFDRKRKKFNLFRPDPTNPNSMSGDIVWTIYEKDGILWIGTHGGGLNRYDRKTGVYTHYRHDPDDPHSLSHDIVKDIFVDRSGTFWIGTHGGGICRFDPSTGRFFSYTHDPDDPESLSKNEIRSIYEDKRGILWIGTYGGGLNRFDRSSKKFTCYRNDPENENSISNDFVRVTYEDRDGVFWVGTQGGGLEIFDRDSGIFTHHRASTVDDNSLSNDYVFSILEDEEGIFWIGTMGGGLNRFDRSTGTFTYYTEADGLSNNSIYGLLEDDQGYIWISTNYGLSRFDPKTESFKNYSEIDGLQSNEFNGGAYFKNESGELFFGGINGMNSFFPEEIEENSFIPPVMITSFTKLNRQVELDVPISELEELVLSYRDYVFSFEFASLDFTAPGKNMYAYKMEGLDDDWVYTSADKRYATYTTLPPGRYTFRVKGSNNDGKWNEQGVSIAITIVPPFWRTRWFQLLAAGLIILIIFLVYNWRLKNVRITTELQAAHLAQMSIMPSSDPKVEGFDISGVCIPANEVGGDFYDYIWLDPEQQKFLIAIGDVSGKAMKAAMIAVMSSGMIYSKASESKSLARIMTDLNRPIFYKTDPNMFTTLCLAAVDPASKEMNFVNAGFSDPVLKSNGSVVSIDNIGTRLPLGVMVDTEYVEKSLRLEKDDVLVLFSDGIPDAVNRSHSYYEIDSLETLLRDMDTTTLSASQIKDIIVGDVMKFAGSTPQNDDMTVVVIKSL